MHDSPVRRLFRGVFVVIDDDCHAVRFNREAAMVDIIKFHCTDSIIAQYYEKRYTNFRFRCYFMQKLYIGTSISRICESFRVSISRLLVSYTPMPSRRESTVPSTFISPSIRNMYTPACDWCRW